MKPKLAFLVTFFAFILNQANAQQLVFYENFEQGIPSSFSLFDLDGLVPDPRLNYPENTAWTKWVAPDDEENIVAASTSYYSPIGEANDWMVLPVISLPDDSSSCQLYWRSRSAYDTYKDGYTVVICEKTDLSPEQLINEDMEWKTICQVLNNQNPTSWNAFHANISGYAGKDVYIGFINNTSDGWMLFIDDITIGKRESVCKAQLQLTTNRFVTDGEAEITGHLKVGILDSLSVFTARLSSDSDTIIEDIKLASVLPSNTKSFFALKNKLKGTPPIARDYKLELLLDSIVFAVDSGRVVFVTELEGKNHIVAEGLINGGQNGGYGPRLIEGYKLATETYGDAFLGIEVHGPTYAEDNLTIVGEEEYRSILLEHQGWEYGRGVVVNRTLNGEAYDDIIALCESQKQKRLICTAISNGYSDDYQMEIEAKVVFGFPLNEASFKYEWLIVEDSLWAPQWNLYSGGLFGAFLDYENKPLNLNICHNGVLRERIVNDKMFFDNSVQTGDTIRLQLQHTVPQVVEEPRHLCAILLIIDAETGEVENAAKCQLRYDGIKPVNDIKIVRTKMEEDCIEYYDILGNHLDNTMLQNNQHKGIIIIKEKKNGTIKIRKINH